MGINLKKIHLTCCCLLFSLGLFAQKENAAISTMKLKVQLLLPLYLDATAELRGADLQWQKIGVHYYLGVLTALDSLEKAGFHIQLFVDDYKGDTNEIVNCLNKPDRQDVDLILGPLYKNGFHVAERFSAKRKTPIFSPFLTLQSKSTNEFTITANPTIESYGRQMARYINNHFDSVNIVLIHDNSSLDKSFSRAFTATLNNAKHNVLRQHTYSRLTNPASVLSKVQYNWVIIPSKDERTVNNLLYKLHDTIQENPMSVAGMQTWLDFSNVNYKVWDTLDVHLLTPYFIDFGDSIVKVFVKQFREKHHTEPDEFVFRGYDQFLVMMYMMRSYGKGFQGMVIGEEYNGMHTNFRFNRESKGSCLENEYLNILRYNQFRFEQVK